MAFSLPISLSRARHGLALGRLLKIFSASVIDQAVLSAANFAVGLLLIRLTTDDDYALYVLVLTAQQLMVMLQRAWLSGPLTLVVSRKDMTARLASVGAVKDAHRRVVLQALLVTQLVPLGAWLFTLLSARMALLVSLSLFAIWASMRRELLRDMLLMFSRAHSVLAVDAVFSLLLVAGTLAATRSHGGVVLWTVVAMAGSAVVGDMLAYRSLARNPGWFKGDAAAVLREVRPLGFWSAVGGISNWLYGSASNYILAGVMSLKAVADVNAARLLLMPIVLLTIGVQSVLNPTAALWHAEVGMRRMTRRLLAFTAGIVVIDLLYVVVLYVSRDWLTGTLLHKQITNRDELLILWTAVVLIMALRDGVGYALFAAGRLKALAQQGWLCAAVGLSVAWFGYRWWGTATGLVSQLTGELINLIGMGLLLRELLRSTAPLASQASSPAGPADARRT
jgi:O-antigen/teichoic acid export membrane protein